MSQNLVTIVLDTNILISAALFPASTAGKAFDKASACTLLTSEETLNELQTTLLRAKFDRYLSKGDRLQFIDAFSVAAQPTTIVYSVTDCRDPKDNKFLELALSGNADLILTGDEDLLILHPWRSIAIRSPADYLHPEHSRPSALHGKPETPTLD